MVYWLLLSGSALNEAGGMLGTEWMAVAEPCVSWLSVCSAKRASASAARVFIGWDVMRTPGTVLESPIPGWGSSLILDLDSV
jgi:hypothetical protein